jgi:hypothetical protein
MSDPSVQGGVVIRFSSQVTLPSEAGWRVVVFRVLSSGLLESVAEVEMGDASSARLWAVSETRRRGRGHRAVAFRPDGIRAFSEGD